LKPEKALLGACTGWVSGMPMAEEKGSSSHPEFWMMGLSKGVYAIGATNAFC